MCNTHSYQYLISSIDHKLLASYAIRVLIVCSKPTVMTGADVLHFVCALV